MSSPNLTVGFSWSDPTTNTDATPVSTGEITGYTLGVRPASGTAGTYPQSVSVSGATATSVSAAVVQGALSLASGNYFAAVRTVGPSNSAWSAEAGFTIPETPNPPTALVAA